MCVIIHLRPNMAISIDKLQNAVLNNPHGWGLAVKDRNKLDIRKECPENGNDPEVIMKVLQDAHKQERFLHVRYNTVGETSIDNCHPFPILTEKGKPQIYFFHNGTIHSYKPGASLTKWSDSRNYAATHLTPLINHFKGENFDYDYTDPFFQTLLGSVFSTHNRGLIISDKFDPLFLGSWEKIIEDTEKPEYFFMASNNDYFRTVHTSRTYSSGRKVIELGDGNKNTGNKTPKQLSMLKNVNLVRAKVEELTTKDFEQLMAWGNDCPLDDLDYEDLSYLAYILPPEMLTFVKGDPVGASKLLSYMCRKFAELLDEYNALDAQRMSIVEKHEKATNHISSLMFEINELNKGGNKVVKAA